MRIRRRSASIVLPETALPRGRRGPGRSCCSGPLALGLAACLLLPANATNLFKSGLETPVPTLFSSGFELDPQAFQPVADAGSDIEGGIGSVHQLDGSRSSDPLGGTLTFEWTLVSRPEGSAAQLSDPDTPRPRLTPDREGSYWVALRVRSAQAQSTPDTLRIRAFEQFGSDSDRDGLSDSLERALGLDPYEEDSFGDGIRDADRDLDADGLTIRLELLIGTDPIRADTDGNGINDGDEDFDRDGLNNRLEAQLGTRPLRADSDGDGWPDGAEVDGGSNPTSAASTPRYLGVASPNQGHLLVRPGTGDAGSLSLNPIVADPNQGHVLVRPGTGDVGSLPLNPIIADPNQGHVLVRPGTGEAGSLPLNPIISDPNQGHILVRPGTGDAGSLPLNPVVAQPPVTIQRSQ